MRGFVRLWLVMAVWVVVLLFPYWYTLLCIYEKNSYICMGQPCFPSTFRKWSGSTLQITGLVLLDMPLCDGNGLHAWWKNTGHCHSGTSVH